MIENTTIIFSDESGEVKKGNYYLRVFWFIDSKDYMGIMSRFKSLKIKYRIKYNAELKFNYIFPLIRKYPQTKTDPKFKPFLNLLEPELLNFISEVINIVSDPTFNSKLIVTYTHFNETPNFNKDKVELDILKFVLYRSEYHCKKNNSFGFFIYDSIDSKYYRYNLESAICERYSSLINENWKTNYDHIKESITFERSNYALGIQIVDVITGIIHGYLKSFLTEKTFEFSRYKFESNISPLLRRVKGYELSDVGFLQIKYPDYSSYDILDKINEEISKL